ncbi:hypothetical protein BGW36DRAFT_466423 [Talaromyces proteolyticus]|uniref:C2H2-type domain-containing protein n=1 Tax=Talaromyces proteolyticus TaxID=1131652 RepID=A0AAD4KF94_9EURO|nr:uncharacterized protein BGW36DRAFT_466423 [Talaromyces proteolyticus]KAH8689560.1 hypothetical protein BGW36DRAFT_466423 [Talaromyces proteolyticus]
MAVPVRVRLARRFHPSPSDHEGISPQSFLLDPSAGLGGRFWSLETGGNVHANVNVNVNLGGNPVTLAPAPSLDAEYLRPLPDFSRQSGNLAALAVPPPGMGTALDALNTAQQPLTARRPAASNLPAFELPPPTNFGQVHATSKLPLLSPVNAISSNVSNLLTPPPNSSAEHSASIPPGSSADVPSYSALWQNQNSYSYAPPAHPSWGPSSSGLYPPPRGGISPSVGPLGRNSASLPSSTEGMSQYDLNHLPPFQQQLPSSSPPTQHPQHAIAHTMIANTLPSTSTAPSHPMVAGDPYGPKTPGAPLFSPSQSVAHGYPPVSYGAQSGLGIHASRMPSAPAQSPPMQPPQLGYSRPPWPSYSLPAMTGPVMTNVHNPSGQMSLMGNMQTGLMPGFTSGHLASMQHMYGGHPSHHQGHGQPAPPNDRPFKCDQCPQSFNRNHDLKRHKRIHLSVKPFPCTHCDKSFSRKDALKRHLLVKGCGKNTDGGSAVKDDEALTKTDSHSDRASPLSNGA